MKFNFFKKKNKRTNLVTEKMKDLFVSWKAYYHRGMAYYDLIKQPAIALAALKIFNVPFMFLIFIIPLWFVLWYAIGVFDRFKAKIWQREAEWGARRINPFEQEVLGRIKSIESSVNNKVENTVEAIKENIIPYQQRGNYGI